MAENANHEINCFTQASSENGETHIAFFTPRLETCRDYDFHAKNVSTFEHEQTPFKSNSNTDNIAARSSLARNQTDPLLVVFQYGIPVYASL